MSGEDWGLRGKLSIAVPSSRNPRPSLLNMFRHVSPCSFRGIVSGHPEMPEFSFEPEEVDAVIAYLESIQVQ